ncbi:hypothetical protein ACIBHY_52345 [Nonomuraea sp. NPDC050547]|uniref:hypothetical protein n=1 Tax=Nonomuraea sp. NPDC050547 TaxID=3364368 RepID=UPI0037A3E804
MSQGRSVEVKDVGVGPFTYTAQSTVSGAPRRPVEDPPPGSYGLDPETGRWRHPATAKPAWGPHPSRWSLDHYDENAYLHNTKIEAFYPIVVWPRHSWATPADFGGRRVMYHYYRRKLVIMDITLPDQAEILLEREYDDVDGFGPIVIKDNPRLGKKIMIQALEIPRFGVVEDKYMQPEGVAKVRGDCMLRGFKVYEMHGPLPDEWELLSEVTTDPRRTAGQRPQEGSGAIDVPVYFGGDYLYIAAAPDDDFRNNEYKTVLWAGAQLVYDLRDPSRPKLLDTWWAPGSRAGEEDVYNLNPRAGNQTSWMGARMPVFVPHEGSRYGYAAMGGFGMYILDVSDPERIQAVGHLELPPSVPGTECDTVVVARAEKTGIVYVNGYPLNQDGFEPYKEIYAVDVSDPTRPFVAGTLPRPVPPPEAPFTDWVQRRGMFGPKRPGYYLCDTGTPDPHVMPYVFYNAGIQFFDVSDPVNASIAGWFVPKMCDLSISDDIANPVGSMVIEWDRRLIWAFSNHGIYLISSPLLGEPVLGAP